MIGTENLNLKLDGTRKKESLECIGFPMITSTMPARRKGTATVKKKDPQEARKIHTILNFRAASQERQWVAAAARQDLQPFQSPKWQQQGSRIRSEETSHSSKEVRDPMQRRAWQSWWSDPWRESHSQFKKCLRRIGHEGWQSFSDRRKVGCEQRNIYPNGTVPVCAHPNTHACTQFRNSLRGSRANH